MLLLSAAAPAAAHARHGRVASIPVSFRVANTNTSGVPCESDGKTYTVRGHLTGPRAALRRPRAVTFYVYGYDAGEWNWRLKVAGYDHATEMARAGHVSLTIDELGYGSSARPDGTQTCIGAQADIAHQIIGMLRSGRYRTRDRQSPRFSRVVLAGHDIGGNVVEIEAYSYKDIDALVQMTWADQGQTPYIVERATIAASDWCTTDPQPANGAAGGPAGYHFFTASAQEFRDKLFFNSDPRVLDAATRLRSRNPCGMIRSTPSGVWLDMARASEITAPVLIMFGADDTHIWSHDGEAQQQQDYPRSRDRTTAFVPRAGHFLMFARTAPEFRSVLGSWLKRHGA